MNYDKYQLWKKDDPDNPFDVDIAVYCPYDGAFDVFLIEVGGVEYLENPYKGPQYTAKEWLDYQHKYNRFNSWYVGLEATEIRVNHKAGAPCGTGFGEKTGYMLPERFMG